MKYPFRSKTLDRRWETFWPTFLGALLLLSCRPSFAIAEDDDDRVAVAVQQGFTLPPEMFDRILFHNSVSILENGAVRMRRLGSIEGLKSHLENALSEKIDKLAAQCNLTDKQKKKMQLAGLGDITRLADHIQMLRDKCITSQLNREEYMSLMAEVQSLAQVPNLLTSRNSSLYRKSLQKCLTTEQVLLYEAAKRKEQVSIIERALDQLDHANPQDELTAASRRQFVEILLDAADFPTDVHSLNISLVFLQADALEGRLKTVLKKSQWEAIQNQVTFARQSESTMRGMGIWPIPMREADPGGADEDGN